MKPESKNPSKLRLIPALLPNNNFEVQSELFIDYEGVLCIAPVKTNITWKDCIYQHIYLCSSLPIKEGDWVLGQANDESFNEVWKHDGTGYISEDDLKIEFTTDPKLITDGVPAIDGNTKAIIPAGGWRSVGVEVSFLEEYCNRYNKNELSNARKDALFYADKCLELINQKDNQKTVDVEKLAEAFARKQCGDMYDNIGLSGMKWGVETKLDFIDGYNQALQSNAGGFSETQVINMLARIITQSRDDRSLGGMSVFYPYAKKWFNENKPTISPKEQPKGDIVIECEMELEHPDTGYMSGQGTVLSEDIARENEDEYPKIKLDKNNQPILKFK